MHDAYKCPRCGFREEIPESYFRNAIHRHRAWFERNVVTKGTPALAPPGKLPGQSLSFQVVKDPDGKRRVIAYRPS